MNLEMPIPEIKGHGVVTPAAKPSEPIIRNDPMPTQSNKQPFDDSPVDGRVDHANEGGISKASSSGSGYGSGVSNAGSYLQQQEDDSKYSLMGFKATIKRADGSIEGRDIRINFDSKALAMACINGSKFNVTAPDGEVITGDVISGMPIVCTGGSVSAEYVQNADGSFAWRRA